ncbi:Coiled-coil domain-containing protein 16 [Gryllus bimaculatus]|nr:Coiled-coil domain-containing protein 16 [Gryllus bimaculatus]
MTAVMSKKKISQDDLRRIMNEQKRKLSEAPKKIESPLAKYSAKGELTCIVCDSVVRSEAVWTVHINSKQHRENIAKLKRKREPEPPAPVPPVTFKRPAPEPPPVPPKKIKGILKNAPQSIPENSKSSKIVIVENGSELKQNSSNALEQLAAESSESEDEIEDPSQLEESEKTPGKTEKSEDKRIVSQDEVLPEGFFDDPLLDAKARNVEYKDPIEEEWEKFQKEIKEETSVSAQIISEDQEEATAERQIDEIDEQMRNWTRVIHLEKKKEEVVQVVSGRNAGGDDEQLSSADEAEFEEYLDWRSKKSYK